MPTISIIIRRVIRLAYSAFKMARDEGAAALIRRIKDRLARGASYKRWILNNEPDQNTLAEQRVVGKQFQYHPLVSIITPVYNTPIKILNAAIRSVIEQTYDNWELCIANGSPQVVNLRTVLDNYARQDPRIKIVHLMDNLGIAGNTNAALGLATGDFIGLLDHDDLLAPFALFEVVRALQLDSELDVIYSDEDKTDKSRQRFNPFFKPDFSPDYLRNVNYMPHFLVVRKSLGDQVGWFRKGYDGAQDYDLILRLVEKARGITHIPKILYHWRAWAGSTAREGISKPYANDAGKKALQEHLERVVFPAQVVDGPYPTFYRVCYQINNTPLVSIIIPNQDQALHLETCINSILQKTTYSNFEIILVENGSKEQETFNLYKRLEKNPQIHLIYWDEPFNYSRINNWAATQANGEVILFLNNDTQVINGDWLEQMLQFAIRQDVGVVGAKLYYPDDTIQHAGVIVGIGGVAGHPYKHFPIGYEGYFSRLFSVQNVSAVTAACMMMRKQVLQEVYGFDESYVLAFGDVDLCLGVLQKGYLNVWTPYAELYHYESKTRGYEDTPEKMARFTREVDYFKHKWEGFLEKGDPYYNPNLTLDHEDFRLKK